MQCVKCDQELPKDGNFVLCIGCNSKLHFKCSGIAETTWRGKSQAKKKEWRCLECRRREEYEEDKNSVDTRLVSTIPEGDIKTILTTIVKDLKDLKDSIGNITVSNEELKSTVNSNNATIQELKGVIEELRREITDKNKIIEVLTQKVSVLEQKQYDCDVEIVGLCSTENTNIEARDKVIELCRDLQVENINESDLEEVFIIKKNALKPNKVIVKFNSRKCKQNVIAKRKLTRENTVKEKYGNQLYINDRLTWYNQNLLWNVKVKAKEYGYKYVWYKDGKVHG